MPCSSVSFLTMYFTAVYGVILSYLLVTFVVHTNAQHPPQNYVKLTLAVSKASYLPFSTGRFLQNGYIMENRFFSSLSGDVSKHDQRACSIGGWTAKSYQNQDTEVLMFTNIQQKLVVFGFRGSELASWDDWAKNADVTLVRVQYDSYEVRVHKGFLTRYGFISSWFEQQYSQIPSDYTILLTGHSLGGAEATIAAVKVAVKFKRIPIVITYGAPKVGDQRLKQNYRQVVGCDRTIRMVTEKDPAPSLPWSFLGYTHVCDAVEVVGNSNSDVWYQHNLYGAYDEGISKKAEDMDIVIDIACDQTYA